MTSYWKLSLTEPADRFSGVLGSVFVCAFLLFCGFVTPVMAQDDLLHDAAENFLELLDDGSYQQAWWEGSELLHLTSDLDAWVADVRIQRELFGDLEGRSLKTVANRTSIPGLPDGEYDILLFNSHFENKQKGLEILTLGKDTYGDWRVVTYRLR